MSKLKTFEVQFRFDVPCRTNGWTIKARDKAEALKKADACIDEDGFIDVKAFEQVGGDISRGTWDHDGDGAAYTVDIDDIHEEE